MAKSVLFVCSLYQFEHFFSSHYSYLAAKNVDAEKYLLDVPEGNRPIASRRGSRDIFSQSFWLYKDLWNKDPSLVVSITPKAGFLVLIARLFLLIFGWKRIRHVHWFTGQVWCNDVGIYKVLKKLPDLFLAKFSTCIFLDSSAQLEFLNSQGFSLNSYFIPLAGSICGVDDDLFKDLETPLMPKCELLRIGVVGRICRDKGIEDLIKWLNNISLRFDGRINLKFFGRIEIENPKVEENFYYLTSDPQSGWVYLGEQSDKSYIFSQIDLLLLCSKREGFSNVLIEAQAFGVPVLVSDIYGVRDSYVKGVTGLCFNDELSLIAGLEKFLDEKWRILAGAAARSFVFDNYKRSAVVTAITSEYVKLME